MRIPRWAVATALAATLNGRFTASAEDQSATIAALLKRIEQLETKVNSLETSRGEIPPATTATTTPLESTRIESLEQQIKVIDRKNEIAAEAAAEKAKTTPVVTAGAGGFSIRSADTNFVLKIRGGLQADGRFYAGDSVANDTFGLRRVRPIIEGTVYGKFDYRVMMDFASGVSLTAGNNGSILDAYGDINLDPAIRVRAGKFKEPVGLERLQSWSNLGFIERGYPTQLLPNRDTGIMLHGEMLDSRLSYQVGAFNGTADGGSSDFETSDPDKDFAARLFAHPFAGSDADSIRNLGLGIAGTIGEQVRTPRTYSTHGSQRVFGYRANTDATRPNVLGDGTQWRISPQGYWYWGQFGLLGEYAISSQEVLQAGGGAGAGATAELANTAWQVELSYFLTGERNSYKPVTPLRPFTVGGDGWGAVEVVGRVGELNPDDDAFPIFADTASSAAKAFSWGLGVNWHLNRFFKVSFNYEHTDLNGLDARYTGLDEENVFLTRLQATF